MEGATALGIAAPMPMLLVGIVTNVAAHRHHPLNSIMAEEEAIMAEGVVDSIVLLVFVV